MKRYTIYTEPHVADPAWIAPVVETEEPCPPFGKNYKVHGTAKELFETAIDLQFKLGAETGRVKETTRTQAYLKSIGWSNAQIRDWESFRISL